jgi:hypothetical protein
MKRTISLKFYNPNIFFQGRGLQLEGQLDYNFRQCQNAYLLHSDVILQIQARWITCTASTLHPFYNLKISFSNLIGRFLQKALLRVWPSLPFFNKRRADPTRESTSSDTKKLATLSRRPSPFFCLHNVVSFGHQHSSCLQWDCAILCNWKHPSSATDSSQCKDPKVLYLAAGGPRSCLFSVAYAPQNSFDSAKFRSKW